MDGLLVALSDETNDFDHLQELVNEEIPIVFLDRMCKDTDAPYVMTDDFKGAKIATDFLVEKGCQRNAFLKARKTYRRPSAG